MNILKMREYVNYLKFIYKLLRIKFQKIKIKFF